MENRLNQRILVVGAPGTGKTHFTKQLIQTQSLDRVVIIDDIDHPAYREFPIYDVEVFPRWKPKPRENGEKTVIRLLLSDAEIDYTESFETIAKTANNTLLVFEDATKYMNAKTLPYMKRLLANSKQNNVDILLLFHAFSTVQPTILNMVSGIVLFKVAIPPKSYSSKLGNWQELQAAYERNKISQNPFIYEYINCQ